MTRYSLLCIYSLVVGDEQDDSLIILLLEQIQFICPLRVTDSSTLRTAVKGGDI